jgi:hypothetical protein
MLARGGENAMRADDIGVQDFIRRSTGFARNTGQMKNAINPRHGVIKKAGISDVADQGLRASRMCDRALVKQAERFRRIG